MANSQDLAENQFNLNNKAHNNSAMYKTVLGNFLNKGFNISLCQHVAEIIATDHHKAAHQNLGKEISKSIHLVPLNQQWVVIPSDGSEILYSHEIYENVLPQARLIAKKFKVKLIIHCDEGRVIDMESFQVNRPYAREAAIKNEINKR